MTKFRPAGPKRFAHQNSGLAKMIATGGVTALLFDPGLGKTAVVLDYSSILALKSSEGETRVLVVCPLAAIDTWVMQAKMFVSDQVSVWAEALGGDIRQRGQALTSRGGSPTSSTPRKGPRTAEHGPRAAYWHRAQARYLRDSQEPSAGPDGLGMGKPRLILEVINVDTLASRSAVCRCHWIGQDKDGQAKCPDGRKASITMADAMLDAIRRFNPDLLVVDESHTIKGRRSNSSMLLARLSDHVKRRVILTGTVMPHSPMDVYAQWRFLAPYAFGTKQRDGSVKKATFAEFQDRFAVMGGWMGREIIGYRNLDVLHQIMAENAIVARKEDALDLPATTTVQVPVLLSAAEKQAYKDMTDNLVAALPMMTTTANNRLTQMLRLRQITSGHLPDDTGTIQQIGRSKVDTIRSLVQDTLTGEKRVVIFAYFTEEINMLRDALQEKGTEVMVITGGTSVEDRALMRKRFGSSDAQRMVMVAQIKTMSLAVNELVTANHAIYGSLSQQRDDDVQSRDRLDRIGQTRPVTFWYCLAPGTVDEVIMKSHQDRTNLEDALLQHVQKIHAGGLDVP